MSTSLDIHRRSKRRGEAARPETFPCRCGQAVLSRMVASLGLAALLVLPAARAADEAVSLRPKWKIGQRTVQQIKTSQKQKTTLTAAAAPIQQQTEQIQELAFVVEKERPEGGYEMSLEFVAASMETKMGNTVVMKFDSKAKTADADSNPMAGFFKKLVGAKFKLLAKPDGEVEKVEGVDKFLEAINSTLPEMIAGMTKSMLNEEMLKQMSGLPQDLPKEPVSPGHEWPVKTELSLGPMGTLLITMKITFTGMERKRDYQCAVLDHKGFITSKEGGGGGPISIGSISGTTTGRSWYVPEIGAVIDSFADQKMKISMKAMGQDANLDMDQRVTSKLIEISGQAP